MSRNASARPSKRIQKAYYSLPEHAQKLLVDDLLSLLDDLPESRTKRFLSAASRVKSRLDYSQRPFSTVLDFKSKQKEVHGLFASLARDTKRTFVGREHSHHQEILDEILHSVLVWLPDIWSVVFEHSALFDEAHQCLMFTSESLAKVLESNSTQCQCPLINMEMDVEIKRQDGQLVESFHIVGVRSVSQVILWIWRDLFVSMSAHTHEAHFRRRAPEMLAEIMASVGLRGLERLLYGGHVSLRAEYQPEMSDQIDLELVEDDYCIVDDVDGDQLDSDEEEYGTCACHFHGSHWSSKMERHRLRLRSLVLTQLMEAFKLMPSRSLYIAIMSVSPAAVPAPILSSFYKTPTKEDCATQLHQMLGDSLSTTPIPDVVASALEIMTFLDENCPWVLPKHDPEVEDVLSIPSILAAHSHRLRVHHARPLYSALCAYNSASHMLSYLPHSPSRGRAQAQILGAIRAELMDMVGAAHAAIRAVFPKMDKKEMQDEVLAIEALRAASNQRRSRVVSFVDTLETGGPAAGGGFLNLGNLGNLPGGGAGAVFGFQVPGGGGGMGVGVGVGGFGVGGPGAGAGAAGGGGFGAGAGAGPGAGAGNGPPANHPLAALLMNMGIPLGGPPGAGGPGAGGAGAGPGPGGPGGVVFGPPPPPPPPGAAGAGAPGGNGPGNAPLFNFGPFQVNFGNAGINAGAGGAGAGGAAAGGAAGAGAGAPGVPGAGAGAGVAGGNAPPAGGFGFAPPAAGLGFGAFMDDDDVMQPDPFHVLAMHGPGGARSDDDPDVEDLREELRPRIKERFDMWVEAAELMDDFRIDECFEESSAKFSGGAQILHETYQEIIKRMPMFRCPDIAAELVDRLLDISKYHFICDALEAVSAFCKIQRKKAATKQKGKGKGKDKKKRPKNPEPWFDMLGPSAAGPSVNPFLGVFVDDDDEEDDGPPPLEPIVQTSVSSLASVPAPAATYPFFGGIEDVD
ncbi:hypothetical protein HGRIS_008929 [Hohenbuehelia grisea]|uniref:Uncharacterized protein n=1 Tax=Hohenbuehelia grisea TaxID=104357 RepID=A0ABR3IZL3_9AGAR